MINLRYVALGPDPGRRARSCQAARRGQGTDRHFTESPEGGWGINGHANTGSDIADAARHELAGN